MASENTWREDLGEKRRLYERLGVREYFLFDPEGEYLRPRLIGFRLVEGRYELIEPDADDRLRSDELGSADEGGGPDAAVVRWDHRRPGADASGAGRAGATARRAGSDSTPSRQRQHAEQERLRADALAAEVERLKALLEQARGGPGRVNRLPDRRASTRER